MLVLLSTVFSALASSVALLTAKFDHHADSIIAQFNTTSNATIILPIVAAGRILVHRCCLEDV